MYKFTEYFRPNVPSCSPQMSTLKTSRLFTNCKNKTERQCLSNRFQYDLFDMIFLSVGEIIKKNLKKKLDLT